ncbi:MAG: hypothetical protein ACRDNO_01535 [Trebonia sp.]
MTGRAVALSAAIHGAWAVALDCGVVIALTGYRPRAGPVSQPR